MLTLNRPWRHRLPQFLVRSGALFLGGVLFGACALASGCAAPVKVTGYPGPAADPVSAEYCRQAGYLEVAVLGLPPAPDSFEEVGYIAVSQSTNSEFFVTSMEKQIEEARVQACQWGADAIFVIDSQGGKDNTWSFWTGLQYWDERNSRIVAIRYTPQQEGPFVGATDSEPPRAIAESQSESPPLSGPPVEAHRAPWNPTQTDLVRASGQGASPRRSAWVSFMGRYGTYQMEDVNREIRSIDALIGPSFDEIHGGTGFGGQIGVRMTRGAYLSLNYERLSASSEVSDLTGRLSYEMPANAFWLGMESFFPAPSADFVLGVGAGLAACDGTVSGASYLDGASFSGSVSGTSLLAQITAGVDASLGRAVSLSPFIGYRYAPLDAEVNGVPLYAGPGERYTIDYSGLLAGLTVRAWLGQEEPDRSGTASAVPSTGRVHERASVAAQPIKISYRLDYPGRVNVEIRNSDYEIVRHLLSADQPEGSHTLHWDGRSDSGLMVKPGRYYYRVTLDEMALAHGYVVVR